MTQRLPLAVQPSSGVPIYRQLFDQFAALIASGHLPGGEYLPSVRQLAGELEINPMTISKAFSRLEADGLVERVRGQGMRVRNGASGVPIAQRQAQLRPEMAQVVQRGRQLGLNDQQILSVGRDALREVQHKRVEP